MKEQKVNVYCFSDTHGQHDKLEIPDEIIDIAIFAGDESNDRNPHINYNQCVDFLDWYEKFPAKYKIFVAGNHSTAIANNLVTSVDIANKGIIYLENSYCNILGFKIFGSPYTPQFGNGWSYNKKRCDMDNIWKKVDIDTDIIISHGPPKGILDMAQIGTNQFEMCGDESLRKHCLRISPKLVVMGHIHSQPEVKNSGIRILNDHSTIYCNTSCVKDGDKLLLSSHGNLIQL